MTCRQHLSQGCLYGATAGPSNDRSHCTAGMHWRPRGRRMRRCWPSWAAAARQAAAKQAAAPMRSSARRRRRRWPARRSALAWPPRTGCEAARWVIINMCIVLAGSAAGTRGHGSPSGAADFTLRRGRRRRGLVGWYALLMASCLMRVPGCRGRRTPAPGHELHLLGTFSAIGLGPCPILHCRWPTWSRR